MYERTFFFVANAELEATFVFSLCKLFDLKKKKKKEDIDYDWVINFKDEIRIVEMGFDIVGIWEEEIFNNFILIKLLCESLFVRA